MRTLLLLAVVLALAPLSGCTLVGIALSPVTGPVDAIRIAIAKPIPLAKLWTVPLLIVCSPLAGMYAGLIADKAVVTELDLSHIPGVLTPWDATLFPKPVYARPDASPRPVDR